MGSSEWPRVEGEEGERHERGKQGPEPVGQQNEGPFSVSGCCQWATLLPLSMCAQDFLALSLSPSTPSRFLQRLENFVFIPDFALSTLQLRSLAPVVALTVAAAA